MRQLLRKTPIRFLLDMVRVFLNRRGSRSAAELSYFLVLSIFPLLIMLNGILGMLHLNTEELIQSLRDFMPAQAANVVADYVVYISDNSSRPLFWAGLIMTLTSSSAAFRALMNITADIYRKPAYPGFWTVVASVVFSIAFLIIMYLSLVVVLTGSWFFSLLKQFLHITTIPGHWSWMRYCLLFALMFLFLALFFRTTVPRAKPRPPVLVGSALTAVLMVAASGLFSWFLGQSSRYSLVYGSLASIIILMVWLYLCGTILILGTVFNYVWYCYQHHSEVL